MLDKRVDVSKVLATSKNSLTALIPVIVGYGHDASLDEKYSFLFDGLDVGF